MDFQALQEAKARLRGKCFQNASELKLETRSIVWQFDNHWYKDWCNKWISRRWKCVAVSGVYFMQKLTVSFYFYFRDF